MILDRLDAKILTTVQRHPTATMAELVGMVGLPQTPCWRRLKTMEDAGVIVGKASCWIRSRAVFEPPYSLTS